MKTKLYPIFIFSVVTFLLSCKSASKLYQKGDYNEAVEVAAKKLQKDPNDKKLQDIILNSYRLAVDNHEKKIASLANSNNELKWEWIYNEYSAMQSMYDAIHRSPRVYELVDPTDYSSELITYAEKAGDIRYSRGLDMMEKNDKQSHKNAYHEFQIALRFKPGNMQVMDKMNEAYDNAVTNVIILPVDRFGFQFTSYNYSYNNNIEDQLLHNLKYNSNNEFVKYYSVGESRSLNTRVDQVIDLRFSDFNLGRFQDVRSTKEVSKQVVAREIVYKPDSIVKVYETVKAKITVTRRTLHSEGYLQLNIRDNKGRWLLKDNLHGNHDWYTEFARYTGDERALSDADKQLVNRGEGLPPNEREIIQCITQEITNNLWCRIRDYYNRF